MINQEKIEWNGDIGVQDRLDICSKEKIWWIKLSNGQAALVAEVNVVVSPVPVNGSHVAAHHYKLHFPGIKTIPEENAYAEAIYQAGIFAGKIMGFNNSEMQNRKNKQNE